MALALRDSELCAVHVGLEAPLPRDCLKHGHIARPDGTCCQVPRGGYRRRRYAAQPLLDRLDRIATALADCRGTHRFHDHHEDGTERPRGREGCSGIQILGGGKGATESSTFTFLPACLPAAKPRPRQQPPSRGAYIHRTARSRADLLENDTIQTGAAIDAARGRPSRCAGVCTVLHALLCRHSSTPWHLRSRAYRSWLVGWLALGGRAVGGWVGGWVGAVPARSSMLAPANGT